MPSDKRERSGQAYKVISHAIQMFDKHYGRDTAGGYTQLLKMLEGDGAKDAEFLLRPTDRRTLIERCKHKMRTHTPRGSRRRLRARAPKGMSM